MKKYLKIFLSLSRYNWIGLMEFRGNFWISFTTQVFWTAIQLAVVGVYFDFTQSIAGWNKYEMLTMVGVFRVLLGVFDIFFYLNLVGFSSDIDNGDFDFVLIKPVNSLFLVSCYKQMISEVGLVVIGMAIIWYGISAGGIAVTPGSLLTLVVCGLSGLLMVYTLALAVACLSFYFTRFTSITTVYRVLFDLIRYSTDIFFKESYKAQALLVPLAVVLTIPLKAFLGKADTGLLILEIIVPLVFFGFTYSFWKYSLKHYTSASS